MQAALQWASVGLCALTSGCASVPAPRDASLAQACTGDVEIRDPRQLADVGSRCREIDGDLAILATDLTDLGGLEQLASVRHLCVLGNPRLKSLSGLRGLRSARGITVMNNPALESLVGLEGLRDLEGAVIVDNGLRSLKGLDELVSVDSLVVMGNPRLEGTDALPKLRFASVVQFEGNAPNADDFSHTLLMSVRGAAARR